MKKIYFLLILLNITIIYGGGQPEMAPYLPPEYELCRKTFLSPDEVVVRQQYGNDFKPGVFTEKIDLAGMWKFSGIRLSPVPFTAETDLDKKYDSASFDDSKWTEIKVPLNWYRDSRFSYRKFYKADQPFTMAWYRKKFDLSKEKLQGKRVLLHFDVIGYEGLVFVNGQEAGHAHGDFVPSRFDITDLVKSGENTLAIRVFSDFRAKAESGIKTFRTHGAKWWWENVKGGLWQPVFLTLEPEIRFDEVYIASDFTGKAIEVRGTIKNHTQKNLTVVFSGYVSDAEHSTANIKNTERNFPETTLKPGENSFQVKIGLNHPKEWDIRNPNLYFLTLILKDKEQIISARAERFGFREFKTDGTGFRLNGKRIYLFGENISSTDFGGFDQSPEKENAIIRELLEKRLKAGVVILRTAHMPPVKSIIQAADELGMMIYDEWSYSFTVPNMDEPRFEKTNLNELARFINRDFNAPSVVMWSLGNEVQHGTRPEAFRQLSKQVELVRKLDFQKRPLVPFSGIGCIAHYGSGKFDADVLDLHTYHGIVDKPWTHYKKEMDGHFNAITKIYGQTHPLITWECIGYTWGNHVDRNFKTGDLEAYLRYAKQKFDWARPWGIGYAAATGLAAIIDPERGVRYAMDRQAGRFFDLYRQDARFQGFAPWGMPPDLPQRARWNQPVYAALRSGQANLPPRNLFAGDKNIWELFLVNDSSETLENPQIRLSIATADGQEQTLDIIKQTSLEPGKRTIQKINVQLPEIKDYAPISAQLRLTVIDAKNREVCRNYANITLENPILRKTPVKITVRIGLFETGSYSVLAEFMDSVKVPYHIIKPNENLNNFDTLLLPPDSTNDNFKDSCEKIQKWVENGGCLVIFEQKAGALPVYTQFLCTNDPNSLADLVLPNHPLFQEMNQSRFDLWSEAPNGDIFSSMISPLTENVLAAKPPFLVRNTIGMAILEAKSGKGHLIASQLNACQNWKKESAATRYLRNLLKYAGNRPLHANARPLAPVAPLEYQVEKEDLVQINLAPWANRAFKDDVDNDGKGGWSDQGANDFRIMPKGMITAAGIPFQIIDPDNNQEKGCLILRGEARKHFPASIRNIRIDGKFSRLFFLHTSAWGNSQPCGGYRFHYADGMSTDYPLNGGRNIGDWWQVKQLPEAKAGFTRLNASGAEIGFFVAEWLNPHPDKTIKSMDFFSGIQDGSGGVDWVAPNASVPILAAVTGEKSRGKPVAIYSGNDNKLSWWGMAWRGGEKPGIKLVKNSKDAPAPYAVKINFPAVIDNGVPVVSMGFNTAKIPENPRFLTFQVKTEMPGVIDLVFPSKDWKSCFMATVQLNEPGRWVSVRLPFRSAFRYTGEAFPLREGKKEFYIYNGLNQQQSYPRTAVNFELTALAIE